MVSQAAREGLAMRSARQVIASSQKPTDPVVLVQMVLAL